MLPPKLPEISLSSPRVHKKQINENHILPHFLERVLSVTLCLLQPFFRVPLTFVVARGLSQAAMIRGEEENGQVHSLAAMTQSPLSEFRNWELGHLEQYSGDIPLAQLSPEI